MTEIEAIGVLKHPTEHISYDKRVHDVIFSSAWVDAQVIAMKALREQAERSKGCEYCTQGEEMAYGVDTLKRTAHIYLDGNLLTADLYSDSMSVAVCYCPMCGRKLKEEKA